MPLNTGTDRRSSKYAPDAVAKAVAPPGVIDATRANLAGVAHLTTPLPVSLVSDTCAFRPLVLDALRAHAAPWRMMFENGTFEAALATARMDLAVTVALESCVPADLYVIPPECRSHGSGAPDHRSVERRLGTGCRAARNGSGRVRMTAGADMVVVRVTCFCWVHPASGGGGAVGCLWWGDQPDGAFEQPGAESFG